MLKYIVFGGYICTETPSERNLGGEYYWVTPEEVASAYGVDLKLCHLFNPDDVYDVKAFRRLIPLTVIPKGFMRVVRDDADVIELNKLLYTITLNIIKQNEFNT